MLSYHEILLQIEAGVVKKKLKLGYDKYYSRVLIKFEDVYENQGGNVLSLLMLLVVEGHVPFHVLME